MESFIIHGISIYLIIPLDFTKNNITLFSLIISLKICEKVDFLGGGFQNVLIASESGTHPEKIVR